MRSPTAVRPAGAGPEDEVALRSAPPTPPRTVASSPPLALLLLVPLLFVAAAQIARSIQVLLLPWEAMYGESIIYDQAQRLLRGEPLYMPYDRPPYSVAAYTPVYYWIGAAAQALIGPGFWPGRAVSLASGIAAAALAGYVARCRTGSGWAWPFAGLLFIALGVPGVYPVVHLPAPFPRWLDIAYPYFPWMALYKEDVLAVALSVGAVALLIGRPGTTGIVLAGLLAGLAFMTKQTTIAPAVAGALWLWRWDRRAALSFCLATAVPIVGISTILEVTTGAFVSNAVHANANPFSSDALKLNLNQLGLFQAGPILVALLWLVARPRTGDRRDWLLALYWVGTLPPLIGLAKVGSNHNHWLELAIATSILATVAFWSFSATRWRALVATLALALHLAALVPLVDTSLLRGEASLRPDADRAAEFAVLVERVRAEERDVLANPLDVIVLAGRPVLLEPYLFSIFDSQGLWSPDPIVERICRGAVGLVVLDQPMEEINPAFHGYAHWPWPVYHVMRETFVRESFTGGRFVYLPRPGTPGPTVDGACARFGR